MDFVIFNDSNFPNKSQWDSQDINDRSNWSWISEIIANWFCYSNAIRKENNLTIVVRDVQIQIVGSEIRYLAPNQRSILSIISNGIKSFEAKKKKKYQPGVYVKSFAGFSQFKRPWLQIELSKSNKQLEFYSLENINTLFINSPDSGIETLLIPVEYYDQALIWLIYAENCT